MDERIREGMDEVYRCCVIVVGGKYWGALGPAEGGGDGDGRRRVRRADMTPLSGGCSGILEDEDEDDDWSRVR
jgi:hypothetical protein